MIHPSVVEEVRRLLATGTLSRKKIAGLTRISRGSVSAIASGKRQLKRPTQPRIQNGERGESGEFLYPSGPPARCPHCGGRVQLPCLACQL